ncbi:hypothetical protein PS6_011870, partial [Mucor atramentarius]
QSRVSAKVSGISSASRTTVTSAEPINLINSVPSSTTLCSSSTTLSNATTSNLTSVTSGPTPTVSQSKRPFVPSPTSSLGEMPSKKILTKKGVVPSSPTVVNTTVNAPPEVATASRITRIPIPRGAKAPSVALKPSGQPHATSDTTITMDIPTTTTTTDFADISSSGSLADWAIDFQVQLRAMNNRFATYETRLNEVERLTAENSQLKLALSDAH